MTLLSLIQDFLEVLEDQFCYLSNHLTDTSREEDQVYQNEILLWWTFIWVLHKIGKKIPLYILILICKNFTAALPDKQEKILQFLSELDLNFFVEIFVMLSVE